MRPLELARAPLAPLTLDACDNCQALWLDATESQQLTPGSLIELFRAISASRPSHFARAFDDSSAARVLSVSSKRRLSGRSTMIRW